VTEAKRPPFPDPIETERLLLRSPRPGDGAEVNQTIRESFADLHEWMDWASYLPDVAETERRIYLAWAVQKEKRIAAPNPVLEHGSHSERQEMRQRMSVIEENTLPAQARSSLK
jgi:hypothetical protein